jgi:hypothetical protein
VHDDTRRRPLPLAPARSTPSPITTAAPHDPHPTPARLCKMYHIAYQSHTPASHRIVSSALALSFFVSNRIATICYLCSIFSIFTFYFLHTIVFFTYTPFLYLYISTPPTPHPASVAFYFTLSFIHTCLRATKKDGWMGSAPIGRSLRFLYFTYRVLVHILLKTFVRRLLL